MAEHLIGPPMDFIRINHARGNCAGGVVEKGLRDLWVSPCNQTDPGRIVERIIFDGGVGGNEFLACPNHFERSHGQAALLRMLHIKDGRRGTKDPHDLLVGEWLIEELRRPGSAKFRLGQPIPPVVRPARQEGIREIPQSLGIHLLTDAFQDPEAVAMNGPNEGKREIEVGGGGPPALVHEEQWAEHHAVLLGIDFVEGQAPVKQSKVFGNICFLAGALVTERVPHIQDQLCTWILFFYFIHYSAATALWTNDQHEVEIYPPEADERIGIIFIYEWFNKNGINTYKHLYPCRITRPFIKECDLGALFAQVLDNSAFIAEELG